VAAEELAGIFSICVPVALLAYIESYSVAHKFAVQNKYQLDPSQELFALGVANVVGYGRDKYPVSPTHGSRSYCRETDRSVRASRHCTKGSNPESPTW
jgi:hypothetical protein